MKKGIKQQIFARVAAMTMAVLVGLGTLATGTVSTKAATGVTDAQVKAIVERNKSYRATVTAEDGWGPECRENIKAFGLADINGDGCDDLIVQVYEGQDPGAFVIYKDGEYAFIWDEWVYCSFYYSPTTHNFMISYNGAKPGGKWESGGFTIYQFTEDSTDTKSLVRASKNENVYDEIYVSGKDYTNSYTEDDIAKAAKKFMPDMVLLEASYKVTKKNLDK